ncbi:hypothetical protein AL542_16530 [Grimontia hollisae]|uniref:Ferric siderophore reductase C-terminal domain-containing protein n=1 Tax=Grimontia hollisae CIP 101886 TaxID=675812 RepID=D0IA87_GRIHO|nr:hypothetical protein [Grimontia hollisae]AMG31785.1 hypothetical protein AL542_16530 [Grimontia hollisae]EEY70805.1 hypothetical protein VHA_002664 [Grimontia hollisae CIP 101886]STO44777.1 Uncharacterized Fe-S protein [Grimontia hollisae]
MNHAFCALLPELQEGTLNTRLALLNPAWRWQVAPEKAVPLGSLLKDDLVARRTVVAFQDTHQAPTTKVAASLVHKQWIANLLSPLVAVYLLSGRQPEQWQKLGYDVEKGCLGWTTQPFGEHTNPALFIETTTAVANACYTLFRRHFSVPPRVLWSNTALALAAPWHRLQNLGAGGEAINNQLTAFFAHFPSPLSQSVKWLVIRENGKSLCVPRRLGCCLKYALPGNRNTLCGTCHRRSEQEQIALVHQRFFTEIK